ncbi:MAG: peptidyl-dipeptidase Dcp, partial [Solirubrobacteraceae bacterium]|nr:peptidyl-dipeptidase Dcp [Solirubrobacteraceae bacterium]
MLALNFDVELGPELEAAIDEHRAEVDAIAAASWPPTFDDTIVALERAGQRLHVAERLFSDTSSARSTPAIRELEAQMLPRLAAHHDAVRLDPRVFRRIADLVARREALELDAEQACVLDRYHRDVVREGATLAQAEQARLRTINERLAALIAAFRTNVHEETADLAVRVATADELDGLPAQLLESAARAADGDGVLLKHSLPSEQPAHEHQHDPGL